ncbi:MAG: DUF262 domain-containing HNH endonuclease family protein [Candidatus Tectomicrobia bacterium]|nr:DUF262 domain-containing HNH endonuclease family protein [Candidatus Tectomicrobia bacterium]
MAKSNLLNTRTINYLELIGNGKSYRVPPYQRDYSWSEEQWEDLWNDVIDLREDADARHYLGALVVEGEDDRHFLIIDGQQRLATLSLLALAVIHRLNAMAQDGIDSENNTERCRELRNRFIGEKDPASLIESSRLHLNETDDAFYQDYLVQLRSPLNPRRLPKSNRQLLACLHYFGERLHKLEALQEDGRAVASLLSDTMARQLLFILITVDDALNAYTVFETLNARGLELTATDLLKNYLFSRVNVRADLDALQRRWKSLVETVGQAQFPSFLRYHLLCRLPKVRSQRLFKLVRDQTHTVQNVFELLGELENRGELYAAILDPTHGYWMELPGARPHVSELNLFRVRQPMPLLFAAWERFSREDFIRLLKLVSTISFRYTIVSGLNTNDLEPVYHRAAKSVSDGEATSPAAIFQRLRPIYVSDEKMRQDFSQLDINTKGKKRLAKYILARLEQHASSRPCDPDTDPGTVEHILPENPVEEWEETYPSDKWDSDVYRLGNLTLLEASNNRDIGNKPYDRKRPIYAQSHYHLTQEIPKIAPEQWTPELVNERQVQLAKVAAQVWKSDFR